MASYASVIRSLFYRGISTQCQSVYAREVDPYTTPISPHPDGLPPDFASVGMKVVMRGVGYPFVLLSLAFLIMRLCARPKSAQHTRRPLDDYLCVVAWIFTAGNAATILAQVGAYKHAYDMAIIDLKPSYFRRMVASCILYGPSMFFAKASIFAMYVRVFGSVPWVRRVSWGALLLFGIGYWSVVPTCAASYFPHLRDSFAKEWDVDLERTTREGMVIPGLVVGACNLATDLVALGIPIPIILGLRMDWKRKVGYCAIFLIGVLGVVVSVLGLVYRVYLIGPRRGDGTWWQAAVNLTTIVELSLSIIISCAPFAVGYWRRVLRNSSVFGSAREKYGLRKSERSEPQSPVELPVLREGRIGTTTGTLGGRFGEVVRRSMSVEGQRESSQYTRTVGLGEVSQDHLPILQ